MSRDATPNKLGRFFDCGSRGSLAHIGIVVLKGDYVNQSSIVPTAAEMAARTSVMLTLMGKKSALSRKSALRSIYATVNWS